MKLQLTSVYINPEQEFTANGKSFKSCRTAIRAKEYGDKWLSGFASKVTAEKLKADVARGNFEIELEITESTKLDKEGKPYINWKFLNQEKKAEIEITGLKQQISSLTKRLEAVELYIEQHQSGKIPSNFSAENVDKRLKEINEVKSEEIKPEDIPW